MVLKDKPHIFKRKGYWYVDVSFGWYYNKSPPYKSLEECYEFVDNYSKEVNHPFKYTQPLISATEALQEPQQSTWSPLLPFKQVWQQVHGIWTRYI